MEREDFKIFCLVNVFLFSLSYLINYIIASLVAGSFGIPIYNFAFPSFFTIWGFAPLSLYGTIGIFTFYFIIFCVGYFLPDKTGGQTLSILIALVLACLICTVALLKINDPIISFLSLRDVWTIGVSGLVNYIMGQLEQEN